jgi:cold shock CspA family protein
MIGEIKWYKQEKGYGFARVDGCEHDFFVHRSNLRCNEALIYPDQLIEFAESKEEKGWTAREITIPEGAVLDGKILGVNKSGYGAIAVSPPHQGCGRFSFRRTSVQGKSRRFIYGAKVAFQPRKADDKCFAIDVWLINPQGWRANIEIDLEQGKSWITGADSSESCYSRQKVYIFRGVGITDFGSGVDKVAYKIGYSTHPDIRLDELRDKYQGQIDPVHEISSDNAYVLEQVLHAAFAQKQYANTRSWEWFSLDESDIDWLKTIHFVNCDLIRHAARNSVGMVGCEVLFRGRGQ